MKRPQYVPQHMAARAERVRQVWIKQHEKEQRDRVQYIIPRAISFSFGYLAGGHGVWFWIISVSLYFVFFYLWRYATKAWKINI